MMKKLNIARKLGVSTKKVIALSLCIATVAPSLVACDGIDIDYNCERLSADVADRFSDTMNLANDLHNSGLISDDTYTKIDNNTKKLNNAIALSMEDAAAEINPSGWQTEDTKVGMAWANIASLDIFYKNNFSNGENYKDDSFNLLQGLIAFKPINHSKNSGHDLDDALNLDSSSFSFSVPSESKDPTQQPYIDGSKGGYNDLYGNNNWEDQRKRPSSKDEIDGAEILYSMTNMMCMHKSLFNVYEGYGNTHLDRWFVKGAYVNSDGTIMSLDTKYNTWAYFNDWKYTRKHASDIVSSIASGGNRASEDLNDNRQELVDALGSKIEWLSEDKYFRGLTKDPNLGYTLSTYGRNNGELDYSHSVYSIKDKGKISSTKIPIDSKYPYSAINSTAVSKENDNLGTLEPHDDDTKGNWRYYTDDTKEYCQDVCFPVNIVPASVVDEFNSAMNIPVYTVKPGVLDTDCGAIASMIGDESKAEEMLNKYFTPAIGGEISSDKGSIKQISSNSTPITLKDIFYAECEKLADGDDEFLDYLLDTRNMIITTTWNDNPVQELTYNVYNSTYTEVIRSATGYGVKNEPGKDIVFCQKVGNNSVTPSMVLRINEFNLTYCSLLNSMLGLFKDTETIKTATVSGADYGKYKLIRDKSNKPIGIVLLEYPVDAIKGFKGNGDKTVSPVFTDSGMGINVGSGKIVKYNYTGENKVGQPYVFDNNKGCYVSDVDSIYYCTKSGGTGIALGDGNTIQVLGSRVTSIGLVGSKVDYSYGEHYSGNSGNHSTTISTDYGVYTPRFYLAVYLEALYAPGLTNDSNVALFGRRFRMINTGDKSRQYNVKARSAQYNGQTVDVSEVSLKYKADDIFAVYIDNFGQTIEYNGEQTYVKMSDLCGIDCLTQENPIVKYFSNTEETIEDFGSESEEHTVVELKHTSIDGHNSDSINTSFMFASNDLGRIDGNSEINASLKEDSSTLKLSIPLLNNQSNVAQALLGSMQGNTSMTDYVNNNVNNGSGNEIEATGKEIKKRNRFWAMAVSKSLFNDEIYNGWLAVSGEGAGNGRSLAWWNTYLEYNSFAYRISAQTFNSYMRKSYKNQMISRGEIEDYDIGTIGQIEDYYSQEAKKERVKTIRTIFKIVGYFIIAFALIIVLLWLMDTNTDMGLNLLQKVTFGNWVAVKYASDIPDNRNMDKKYITSSKLVIRVVILIAVGLTLIVVNTFDIVKLFVDTFGSIAKTIEDIIKGN